jgi:hypothetical protein
MVGTLIGSFFVKHIPDRIIQAAIIIHFLIFIAWLLFRNNNDTLVSPGLSNYFFLAFFCSGILCAGIIARLKYPIYLKLYFFVYLLSLLVFVLIPSRVIGFIASGNLKAINPDRIHIRDNYYFVEQKSMLAGKSTDHKQYKLIREMGMFHKTLARDINLPVGTDSALMMTTELSEEFRLMIYYSDSLKTDSLLLEIHPGDQHGPTKKIEQKRPH